MKLLTEAYKDEAVMCCTCVMSGTRYTNSWPRSSGGSTPQKPTRKKAPMPPKPCAWPVQQVRQEPCQDKGHVQGIAQSLLSYSTAS